MSGIGQQKSFTGLEDVTESVLSLTLNLKQRKIKKQKILPYKSSSIELI